MPRAKNKKNGQRRSTASRGATPARSASATPAKAASGSAASATAKPASAAGKPAATASTATARTTSKAGATARPASAKPAATASTASAGTTARAGAGPAGGGKDRIAAPGSTGKRGRAGGVKQNKPAGTGIPAGSQNLPAGLRGAGKSAGAAARARDVPARRTAPAPARAAAAPAKRAEQAKQAAAPAGDGHDDDLPAWAAKAAEKLLTVTCWLDPGTEGEPFSATIRFSGRREGVTGRPQPGDTFVQEETAHGIVPGSGPAAITAEIRGVSPGEWAVTARPVARPAGNPFRTYPLPGPDEASPQRVPLPRRIQIPASPDTTIRTANLLLAKVPGIFRPAYASLITLGVLAGLALESVLLITGHYGVLTPLLFSLAAVAAGAVGGKLWYIAVHRGAKRDGYCIQGFIAGAAVVVVAVALAGAGVPGGVFLSVTAPAVLIGMAIGRPGCFWAGCCTGRPTASRWGIWSSDRRLGCRRMPAQLLEALASLVIGAAVVAVVLTAGLARSGPVAVAGLAAYTLARQFIVLLRAEPPAHWRYSHPATVAAASVALIASVVLLVR